MPAKLKPCPFCATTGRAVKHLADMGDHWVKCTFCNSTIGSCHSEEEAVAKWNKRAYINVENFNDRTTGNNTPAEEPPTPYGEIKYAEQICSQCVVVASCSIRKSNPKLKGCAYIYE